MPYDSAPSLKGKSMVSAAGTMEFVSLRSLFHSVSESNANASSSSRERRVP